MLKFKKKKEERERDREIGKENDVVESVILVVILKHEIVKDTGILLNCLYI